MSSHSHNVTEFNQNPPPNRTFASQDTLPKLPVPKLEDTLQRYLTALEGLQDEREHAATTVAVDKFLKGGDGAKLQKELQEYASVRDRYAESVHS